MSVKVVIYLLLFIVGMVAGAAVVYLVEPLQSSHSKVQEKETQLASSKLELAKLQSEIKKHQKENEEFKTKIAGLEKEVQEQETKLKNQLEELSKKAETLTEKAETAGGDLLAKASNFLSDQKDTQLEALKSSLNLTSEQETKLKDFLNTQGLGENKTLQDLLSSNSTDAASSGMRQALDEELAKWLSPEQKELYAKFKQGLGTPQTEKLIPEGKKLMEKAQELITPSN
ncbi:MAG: hypothetical protein AAF558_14870 [Verrucomicrobiota bacterium]